MSSASPQAIGRIVDVSQDLLGATVLAWGEAVPELVATLSLARSGQVRGALMARRAGRALPAYPGCLPSRPAKWVPVEGRRATLWAGHGGRAWSQSQGSARVSAPEMAASLSMHVPLPPSPRPRCVQATMAIAAVFGGPIFNVLIAWAGPTLVAALRHHGPMPYRLSPGVGVLVVFTLVVLTFLLAAMPLAFRWRLDRRAAWAVLGIYGVSQVLFLAAEAGGG